MIYIPLNVPSSKNSKQWTGRFFVWSKTAQKYVKMTKNSWESNKEVFLNEIRDKEFPIKVSFKFIRGTRHQFDYLNPAQTILDLMVKYEWIPDDNADIILPIFEQYEYNKANPGIIITVL